MTDSNLPLLLTIENVKKNLEKLCTRQMRLPGGGGGGIVTKYWILLHIHLFHRQSGTKKKLNTYIQFPATLDLGPYLPGRSK